MKTNLAVALVVLVCPPMLPPAPADDLHLSSTDSLASHRRAKQHRQATYREGISLEHAAHAAQQICAALKVQKARAPQEGPPHRLIHTSPTTPPGAASRARTWTFATVRASLRLSHLWRHKQLLHLDENMRIHAARLAGRPDHQLEWFADFLLAIGKGRPPALPDPLHSPHATPPPPFFHNHLLIPTFTLPPPELANDPKRLINHIYGSFDDPANRGNDHLPSPTASSTSLCSELGIPATSPLWPIILPSMPTHLLFQRPMWCTLKYSSMSIHPPIRTAPATATTNHPTIKVPTAL